MTTLAPEPPAAITRSRRPLRPTGTLGRLWAARRSSPLWMWALWLCLVILPAVVCGWVLGSGDAPLSLAPSQDDAVTPLLIRATFFTSFCALPALIRVLAVAIVSTPMLPRSRSTHWQWTAIVVTSPSIVIVVAAVFAGWLRTDSDASLAGVSWVSVLLVAAGLLLFNSALLLLISSVRFTVRTAAYDILYALPLLITAELGLRSLQRNVGRLETATAAAVTAAVGLIAIGFAAAAVTRSRRWITRDRFLDWTIWPSRLAEAMTGESPSPKLPSFAGRPQTADDFVLRTRQTLPGLAPRWVLRIEAGFAALMLVLIFAGKSALDWANVTVGEDALFSPAEGIIWIIGFLTLGRSGVATGAWKSFAAMQPRLSLLPADAGRLQTATHWHVVRTVVPPFLTAAALFVVTALVHRRADLFENPANNLFLWGVVPIVSCLVRTTLKTLRTGQYPSLDYTIELLGPLFLLVAVDGWELAGTTTGPVVARLVIIAIVLGRLGREWNRRWAPAATAPGPLRWF